MTHALANAREALDRRLAESTSQRRLLQGVAEMFALDSPPRRIEVYDNSHISGTRPVGAMIVAGAEGLMRSAYRRFNVRGGDTGDDYAMMREVLRRRFGRLQREDPDNDNGEWPDLVLLDGGAGQLSSALAVLADLGIDTGGSPGIAAIAKGPDRNAGRERIHLPGRRPFMVPPNSPVSYFLQRLRDEAHRFAIGGHRARRSKAVVRSELDEIAGVGAKRKRALLHRFGSARGVAAAGLEDLEKVDGVSKFVARRRLRPFPRWRLTGRAMPATLPNVLTLSRIAVIPLLVGAFHLPTPFGPWLAFALFAAAGATDFLDGWLARRMDRTTEFGRFLGSGGGQASRGGGSGAARGRRAGARGRGARIILCREILVSALREDEARHGGSVPVSRLAKWKTASQMGALGLLLIGDAAAGVGIPPALVLALGAAMLWLAAGLAVATAADYMRPALARMAGAGRPRE